ncbi:uncharacterized protein AB675_9559 [Cyphellophora attinorum]|uniref:Uncharacterized protein n=1 Tax=Cyphellophora attinorum TaxID=1664694 RepID=A0A0N1HCR2_9EURO|nr:uncharacterized protein AB675_9559 [Phialophora attinorum]KPI42576.1 hypothetical protein AB675_9559 [Phialophora attinorum]
MHASDKPLLENRSFLRQRSISSAQNSAPEIVSSPNYSTFTLKSFHLHALARLLRIGPGTENKKVAIYHSRLIALILTLTHWVPFGAALTLLVLNSKGIIVADEVDVVQNNLYQFGAKLFELLMQASIATIILGIVRSQALEGNDGLPLGMLMASARTHDVSYLWSSEFFGSLTSTKSRWMRQYARVFAVALLILLATVVGPSGAILLLPSQSVLLKAGYSR